MAGSFALIDAVSSAGKSVNEDAFGASGAYAWIIDGATGIGEREYLPPTGAAWLAQTLSRAIAAAIAAEPAIGLDRLLDQIAAEVTARFDAETASMPRRKRPIFRAPVSASCILTGITSNSPVSAMSASLAPVPLKPSAIVRAKDLAPALSGFSN